MATASIPAVVKFEVAFALEADRVVEGLGAVHEPLPARCELDQQHFAARRGPPGLDKAQMPRRDACVAGEIELAQAPALAPFAQQVTNRPHGAATEAVWPVQRHQRPDVGENVVGRSVRPGPVAAGKGVRRLHAQLAILRLRPVRRIVRLWR